MGGPYKKVSNSIKYSITFWDVLEHSRLCPNIPECYGMFSNVLEMSRRSNFQPLNLQKHGTHIVYICGLIYIQMDAFSATEKTIYGSFDGQESLYVMTAYSKYRRSLQYLQKYFFYYRFTDVALVGVHFVNLYILTNFFVAFLVEVRMSRLLHLFSQFPTLVLQQAISK